MNENRELRNFILENFESADVSKKSFLKKFRDILVFESSLEEFIKSISLGNLEKEDSLGIYDPETQMIIIDLEGIREHSQFLMSKCILSPEFLNYFRFKFFQTTIHEVVHAGQDRDVLNPNDNSIVTKTLRDGIYIHGGDLKLNSFGKNSIENKMKGKKIYNRYHDLFLGEREAEMRSFGLLFSLYEEAFSEDIIGLGDLASLYYNIMINGYSFGKNNSTCPMREFYKVTENLDVFNSFNFDEYDISARLIYGMPLTRREFNKERERILGF